MNVRQRAEKAVQDACAAISASLDEEKTKRVADVIERALIDMMRETAKEHNVVVRQCCSSDLDMAHKIAEEIKHRNDALVANLKGLR